MLSPCRFNSAKSFTSHALNRFGASSIPESMPATALVRGGENSTGDFGIIALAVMQLYPRPKLASFRNPVGMGRRPAKLMKSLRGQASPDRSLTGRPPGPARYRYGEPRPSGSGWNSGRMAGPRRFFKPVRAPNWLRSATLFETPIGFVPATLSEAQIGFVPRPHPRPKLASFRNSIRAPNWLRSATLLGWVAGPRNFMKNLRSQHRQASPDRSLTGRPLGPARYRYGEPRPSGSGWKSGRMAGPRRFFEPVRAPIGFVPSPGGQNRERAVPSPSGP